MNFAKTTALGLVLALGVTAAQPALAKKDPPADQQPKGPDFSKPFRAAVQPLQKAIVAKDWATAQTALPAAQTAASTPDDKNALGLMTLQIGLGTQNTALQKTGADLVIATGLAPADTMKQVIDLRGRLAYNEGDFATADQDFTRLTQLDPNNSDALKLLAAVKEREGKSGDALQIAQQSIHATQAAGQKPDEDTIRHALKIAYDQKNPAQTAEYGQLLAQDYPSPQAWRTALETFRDTNKLNEAADLDTLRLMRAANALAGERDYYEYASILNQRGFPGEAKAVIDQGLASNQVDNQSVKTSKVLAEIRQTAGSKVAADRASLPQQDQKAMAASTGTLALNTGDAHLGYGEYAQAITLYKAALQKGGVDPNIVNMRLGEAYALSHQKQLADQAFGAVTGPEAPVAKYWMIWADQQG